MEFMNLPPNRTVEFRIYDIWIRDAHTMCICLYVLLAVRQFSDSVLSTLSSYSLLSHEYDSEAPFDFFILTL